MSTISHRLPSKRERQTIARFDYYLRAIEGEATSREGVIEAEKDVGPSRFYCWRAVRDRLQYFQVASKELLTYMADLAFSRPKETKDRKNQSPITITQQLPEITVIEQQRQQTSRSSKSIIDQYSPIASLKTKTCRDFAIYISRQSQSNQWVYFVERLTMTSLNQNQSQLVYESILGLQRETGLLNNVLRSMFPNKTRDNIIKYAGHYQQKVSLFQSALAKQLKHTKIKATNQERMSHPQFRREDRLPVSEYKKFTTLKTQIYLYYSQLNKHRTINTYSIDNLICRFLKFKEYNYQESLKAVKNYLLWEKDMRSKYSYQGFEKYNKLGLYELAGRDYKGRVILLFRPYLFYYEQTENLEEYVDYTLYMLDLFIQDNSEGYIDDFILLADYEPFTTDNFKISVARDVAEKSKDLFPDRQFKLICYGLGSFSYFTFRMIKPFLPNFVLEKAAIFGTDKQQLLDFLAQHMDIESLPAEVLGRDQRDKTNESTINPIKK